MTATLGFQNPSLPVISREVTLPVGAYPTPDVRLKRCIEIGAELATSSPVPVENLVNPRATGQDPLSTSVDRLGPPLSRNFDLLWSTLTEPATTCQIGEICAHRCVCANLPVGGELVSWLRFINTLVIEPRAHLGNSFTELTHRRGYRRVSKSRNVSRWVMCPIMRGVFTQVQFEQSCTTNRRDSEPPFTGMPQSSEHSWKFRVPTPSRCDRPLALVQSTSTTSQAVERVGVHAMLTHDPIAVTDELLQGRRSKRSQTALIGKGVGFAEYKAYFGSKRLSLMEFATYCRGSLRVGRNVLGVSKRGKVISADDPTPTKQLTHPVIEDRQYREGAWCTHKGTTHLRDIDGPPILIHAKTFSKLLPCLLGELRSFVTDIMHIRANSEITLEFGTEEGWETSLSQAPDDCQDGIMSETVGRPGKVCREVDHSRHPLSYALENTVFRMWSIWKNLRYSRHKGRPENLTNQVSLDKHRGRRDGNDSCLHPQLGDYGRVMSNTYTNCLAKHKRGCKTHVSLGTDSCWVHVKLITPYPLLDRVLEVIRKFGGFLPVWVVSRYSAPRVTTGNTAPTCAGQIGHNLVETTLLAIRFNHCGRRRRHRVTRRLLERTSQRVADMFLNALQVSLGSNMSRREVPCMRGHGFFLHLLTSRWESASEPTKGQLTFHSETTIEERKEPCWEVVGLRKTCTSALKSRTAELRADCLKGTRDFLPSHAIARKGYPPTYFPRTTACSNTTRDQGAPSSLPQLLGVHRHPTTRDVPTRSPSSSD
uniref:RNA-dependent RNA polymerase n=1 Tax=Exserohilum turcicum narnavirus 3 TaxID=3229035 RepID=A0AAU7YDZ2_9VIRU